MANNTSILHLKKLRLGGGQFPRIQTVGFGKKGGPGTVGRSWNTPYLGVEAGKLLGERTSGYSEMSFRISLGAVWRWGQNRSKAEGEGTVERTSRESESSTQAPATSTNKVWCWRISTQRMGTETGASWKDQKKR